VKYLLGDKLYTVLKWIGLIACPAVAVFVSTVGAAWGWANIEPVVITINAFGVLIGALIGISQASAKVVPPDERAPETGTMPADDGSVIFPLTDKEIGAVFAAGGTDAD